MIPTRFSFKLTCAALVLCPCVLLAQTKTVVIPAKLGYSTKSGESWLMAPAAGGGFLAFYTSKALQLPNRAVIREISFRPPSYKHGATKRAFDVFLGYPASGIKPETMPLDRNRIVAGGLKGLTKVASRKIVSMPAFTPSSAVPPFGVRIPISPFIFDAKKGGLIVQIVGFKVGNQNAGYLMDIMKRDSDATPAPIQILKSSCIGSSGAASFLKITDARSWAPAGHGIVRLAGFSTQLSVLFLGSAVDKRFPVDLKVIGKPGCILWTLPEVLVPVKLRRIRRTFAETVVLSVPNNPALAGARFRMQAFELDARAPVAGIRVSSGLDVRLGKQGTRSFVARTIHRLSPSDPEIIDSAEGAPILRISY